MHEAVSIEVVVEQSSATAVYPWSFQDTDQARWIRLHGATSDEDIGSLMVTTCEYNDIASATTPEAIFGNILANEDIVLPGGFRFSQNEVPKIVPGCCSGLEGWREWLGVLNNDCSVWAGHDPSPWVERREDVYRLWSDEGEGGTFIDLDKSALAHLLHNAETDLRNFVHRLREWTSTIAPDLSEQVVVHFARNMDVSSSPAS